MHLDARPQRWDQQLDCSTREVVIEGNDSARTTSFGLEREKAVATADIENAFSPDLKVCQLSDDPVPERLKVVLRQRNRVEVFGDLDPVIPAVPSHSLRQRTAQPSRRRHQRPTIRHRQGRVLIPAYLRDEVGLDGDAIVAGIRDHAEIWAPARWADYRVAMDDPKRFAEAIAGLGI